MNTSIILNFNWTNETSSLLKYFATLKFTLSTSCKAESLPRFASKTDHLELQVERNQVLDVAKYFSNMDPNYVNEEEEAAAMAAMMGFSGFGSQKPLPKKRKFTTDAFVEGQDVMSLDRGGKKGQGSGGNITPLGKSRVFGTGSSNKTKALTGMNEAEIELGDEDEEETEGPQYVDTSLPPPIISGSEGAPQYVDTSQPPPASVANEEAREVQSRIDVSLDPSFWLR
jgi:hypothetical protein